MDWSNERYVRLYTRDTVTWKLLDWRARVVLTFLVRKVDRAGVLDVGHDGVLGLAAVLELPFEIVEPGIAQLTTSRGGQPTVIDTGTAYLLPNFIEAQEATSSDPQRKRESRSRRRDLTMAQSRGILPPGSRALLEARESGHETGHTCHETGPDRDARSQVVTSGHSVLSLAEPSLDLPTPTPSAAADPVLAVAADSRKPARARRIPSDPTPEESASVQVVLEKLGKCTGVSFRGATAHVRLIVGRLREGVSELELRAVVAYCDEAWEKKPDMRRYLRPETLFGPETIAKYLDPARARFARELAAAEPQPRLELIR